MAALLALLFIFLWIPAASMLSGVALETLWYWFIVPLGAPNIGVAHAMGIALIVHFLIFKQPDEKENKKDLPELLVGMVLQHLLVVGVFLLFGYCVKSYM